MKTRLYSVLATMLTGILMLNSCSAGDSTPSDDKAAMEDNVSGNKGLFDGEWTVNRQVVDTAKLEVFNHPKLWFRLRLPEVYLTQMCFTEHYRQFTTMNAPTEMTLTIQGYSENAEFMSFNSYEKSDHEGRLYNNGSFYVRSANDTYRVDLLSNESGNMIYSQDTGLWTIGITVNRFQVTSIKSGEAWESAPPTVINLYYNAKKRIR